MVVQNVVLQDNHHLTATARPEHVVTVKCKKSCKNESAARDQSEDQKHKKLYFESKMQESSKNAGKSEIQKRAKDKEQIKDQNNKT